MLCFSVKEKRHQVEEFFQEFELNGWEHKAGTNQKVRFPMLPKHHATEVECGIWLFDTEMIRA